MNYLEIFNKVMLELNYRPVSVLSNIFKNEHLRILENIKRTNSEICSSHDWDFLRKVTQFKLPAGAQNLEVDPEGKITAVYEKGQKLRFNSNFEEFFNGAAAKDTYGSYNGKPVFAVNNSGGDRIFKIFYTTNAFALDEFGTPKTNFEAEKDISIIPKPFCEDILVYGACVKTKANPAFPKFSFWNSNYIRALARMRTESSATLEEVPSLSIKARGAI